MHYSFPLAFKRMSRLSRNTAYWGSFSGGFPHRCFDFRCLGIKKEKGVRQLGLFIHFCHASLDKL